MTEIADVGEITDMDEHGNIAAPASVQVAQAAASIPDPPGIRKQFTVADDHALDEQLEELRARRGELSAHAGHTRADMHDAVDERVVWARRRIAFLDREFATALDRNPAVYPSPEHATLRMMAEPSWAEALHVAVDAKPACERPERSSSRRPPRPRHDQVSCFDRDELRAAIDDLASQIKARETELRLRARRRVTYQAQQAERELEASLERTKGK